MKANRKQLGHEIVPVRDLWVFLGVDVGAQTEVLAIRRLLSALFREVQHVLRGRHLRMSEQQSG